ncbi:hypothetical protein KOR42_38510 [Thalassoglobus neptunius]|uniref:Uncharacterized protein n=1 Tax=Thalassoglobus neptunius TaxID=1938619 RepID=A0A5C5WIE6_9PLAN|nr:hypothetical protein KOR42_38510 [Thalassoglobus neptunius]
MTSEHESTDEVKRDRLTFYPVIVVSAIFCISIFIVIAATFGDQLNPANRWINRNANSVLIIETVVLVIVTLGAMTIDRVRTLKKLSQTKSSSPVAQESSDVD